jgi:hypothetical protein
MAKWHHLPILLVLLLPAAALPLAVAPPTAPSLSTPRCPNASYPDAAALIAALYGANYGCSEDLAAALRPRADRTSVEALLTLANSDENDTARRNALRALGRLAESPRGTRAYELMQRTYGAAMYATLARILERDSDNYLLQDAIWLADTFYFPAYQLQPAFQRISRMEGLPANLRERAASAVGRLSYARPGPLQAADLAYALGALGDSEPGVRAQAALLLWRLRNDQRPPEVLAQVVPALEAALASEPPLALARDGPIQRVAEEPTTTALAVRAALARALDRHAPQATSRYQQLRSDYETLALPRRYETPGFVLRGSLPASELAALGERSRSTWAAALEMLGPALRAPIPDELATVVAILVFPSQAAYREYLRAFTGYNNNTDGIYAEAEATLYTYERTAGQTENTLVETLQHELTHAVTGRHMFAGQWHHPGYHTQPKGWADEGLAEVLASTSFAADGRYTLERNQEAIDKLCQLSSYPDLSALLYQRAGYDRFGRFDYESAWALSYFLLTEHRQAAHNLYRAYRNGTYSVEGWPGLAGFGSLAAAETAWHGAMREWCVR